MAGAVGFLSLLLLLIVGVLGVLYWRTRRARARLGSAIEVLPPFVPEAPQSPLVRVTLQEAVESDGLTNAIADYNRDLIGLAFELESTNCVIQAASLSERASRLTLHCRFTREGEQLYRDGMAVIRLERHGDNALPMLADSDTGKFLEMAKAQPLKLAKLAQVSAVIVSAAHVISGLDVVYRLDKLDEKVSELLEGRCFDQHGKLHRIYAMARERLSRNLTDGDKAYLLHLRGELYELRDVWRQELEAAFNHLPHPENAWFGWTRRRKESKLRDHVLNRRDRLRNTRIAFAIDLCLAQATDTTDTFLKRTAVDEAALWSPIIEKFSNAVAQVQTPELRVALEVAKEYSATYIQALTTYSGTFEEGTVEGSSLKQCEITK